MSGAWMENTVFFNVENVMETYAFAEELRDEFILHSTGISDHVGLYDAHEEELFEKEGKDYYYTEKAGLSTGNQRLMENWKYAPFCKVLRKMDAMQFIAVFVLLSVYISILSLVTVCIISYVRSVTIALNNRVLFDNLKKLGANRAYEERVIKMQLRKIFAYPVTAGCVLGLIFSLFMVISNDMHLELFELKMIGAESLFAVVICIFLYAVYRISLRKVKAITEV